MKKYKTLKSKQYTYIKKRIAKTRAKATFVGFMYLIATIVLAALACFPMVVPTVGNDTVVGLGVLELLEFWKVFTALDLKSTSGVLSIAVAVIYGLMLLGILINVIKAISKLGWLFKKKASRTYGFNRNVYAMQDLGKIFSGTFAAIVIFNLLIWLVSESVTLAPFFLMSINVMGIEISNILVVLAVGILFHLWLGFVGGKVSLFLIEEGVGIVEEKRQCGRFAPLFRNLLQIAATFAMVYFFITYVGNGVYEYIVNVVNVLTQASINDMISYVLGDIAALATLALEVLIAIWLIVLVYHTVNTTEYNLDGAAGYGMKNYTVFSFFTFLFAAGIVAVDIILAGNAFVADTFLNTYLNILIVAGIALVMFIIQLIMNKAPALPGEEEEEIESEEVAETEVATEELSDDVDIEWYLENHHVAPASYYNK